MDLLHFHIFTEFIYKMTQSENNMLFLVYENNQADCLWNVETDPE